MAEGEELPRRRTSRADLSREAFDVPHPPKPLPEPDAELPRADELRDRVEAAPDRLRLDAGTKEPLPEHPRAHRGHRVVEDLDQRTRPTRISGPERLDEFEVPAGHLVEEHLGPRTADRRPAEVPGAPGLELGEVLDERPGGAHEEAVLHLEAEAVERVHPVVAKELVRRDALVEEPVAPAGERGATLHSPARETVTELSLKRGRDDELGSSKATELRAERGLAYGLDHELPCRKIHGGEPDPPSHLGGEEDEVVVPARIEKAVLEDGPRRHRLHDLASNEPLRAALRLLHLIADRHPPPELYQAGKVFLERLRRNARERDTGRRPVVPGGEGEAEEARSLLGVLPEELVEVSHAEEEEGIRVAALHLPPLAHERGLPTVRGELPSGHAATCPPGSTRRSGR